MDAARADAIAQRVWASAHSPREKLRVSSAREEARAATPPQLSDHSPREKLRLGSAREEARAVTPPQPSVHRGGVAEDEVAVLRRRLAELEQLTPKAAEVGDADLVNTWTIEAWLSSLGLERAVGDALRQG